MRAVLIALVLLFVVPGGAQASPVFGTVTGDGYGGLFNVHVAAYDATQPYEWSAPPVAETYTSMAGDYSLELDAGSYRLKFESYEATWADEWWNDKATWTAADPIAVLDGYPYQADVVLAAGASITGVIGAAGTGPLYGAGVTAFDAVTNEWRASSGTTPDGAYRLDGLAAGSYKLSFTSNDSSWLPEWWNDKPTFATADPIELSAGEAMTDVNVVLAPGAIISGTVTADGGGPLEFAYVAVQPANGGQYDWVVSVSTASDGHFTAGPLPAGDYKLKVDSPPGLGYLTEWWNDRTSFASADVIPVASGEVVGGKDVALAHGAQIGGTVRNSSGDPLSGIRVYAYDAAGGAPTSTAASAVTDSAGAYALTPLATGSYKIEFRDSNGHTYLGEWWDNKPTFATADPIAVGAAEEVIGKDVVLDRGATIAGTVTGAGGGPLDDVSIHVYPAAEPASSVVRVRTDSSGHYLAGPLLAGSYKLSFSSQPGTPYLGEWWNDKPTRTEADAITLAGGEAATGKDAELALGATIAGTISAEGGAPIQGVSVSAFDAARSANDPWIASTSSDSSGNYVLGPLAAGSYKLQFRSYGLPYLTEWWDGEASFAAADPIAVAAGDHLTGKDALLVAGATISGTITTPGGIPLQGASVNAYDAAGSTYAAPVAYASSATDGSYSLTALPAGSYKLRIQAPSNSDWLSEWFNNAGTFETATSLPVALGQTLSGKDVELSLGSSIAGTVTAAGGGPLTGIRVSASGTSYASAQTDAGGHYTLRGLGAGSYTLRFEDQQGLYVSEWWNDKVAYPPDTIIVGVAQDLTGYDAALALGGSISGTVTGAGAGGLAGISVSANGSSVNVSATTDANGHFRAAGLPAGSYKVRFDPPPGSPYIDEWWNDKPSSASADLVAVAAGEEHTGIDAVLARGATIAGHVTASGGVGLGSVTVTAYRAGGTGGGEDQVSSGYTNPSGDYVIGSLPAGSYKLEFRASNGAYVTEWYDNEASFADASVVTVQADDTRAGINAELAAAAAVSGTVTGAGTGALANIYVVAFSASVPFEQSQWVAGTGTDPSGHYVLHLPAGSFKLVFWPMGQNWAFEWWNDKGSFESADAITVSAGQTVGGIDAVLAPGATISGTVTAAAGGVPVASAGVYVHPVDDPDATAAITSTGPDGTYSAPGLRAGSYKVEFRPYGSGVGRQWWDGKTSFATADTITLAVAEARTGIDAALPADAAPDTTIDGGPKGATSETSPSFAFSASEPDSTFECKLDGPGAASGSYGYCESPQQYTGLADGAYTFSVRATDDVGNADESAATHSFTVDTAAPQTTIDSSPPGSSTSTTATFTFSSEPGATFECRLEGGSGGDGFEHCASPKEYTGLGLGTYTFSVRALDAAGNVDPTPATHAFTLESGGAPVVGPSNKALPTISGTAVNGGLLSGSDGSWSGTPPIRFAYQWLRCDARGESCSDIGDATATSYGLSSADVGRTIRLRVTATNAEASASATSAATAVVTAAAPPTTAEAKNIAGPIGKMLKRLHLRQIRHDNGFVASVMVPDATQVKIQLLLGKLPGATAAKKAPTLLAQGVTKRGAQGRVKVKVALTAAGKKALKNARRATVTLRVTLKRAGGTASSLKVAQLRR